MKHLKAFTVVTIISLAVLVAIPAHPQAVHSQDGEDDACVAIVEEALQAIGSACAELGRNEACYGHINVEATFRENVEAQFENNGDIVDVGNLESLLTQAADPSGETWGVALVNLQADLPDDSEESVTLVLFGDAEITSAVTDDADGEFTAPMQAITLRSGETDACEQAPDGLLIRSPEGQRARVMVNGVELTLSSATFITADADSDMGIQGLEGEIEVTAQGQTEMVIPGFISTVELDENFEPDSPPTPPEPVEPDIAFPFDVFAGVFPDAEPISGSDDGASSGLSNTFSGASFSFSYPEGWFVEESALSDANIMAVVATNNSAIVGQVQSGFDELPSGTTFLVVYTTSDFAALLEGGATGTTPDELVRSYAELLSFGNLVSAGPEILQIGPHSVTWARYNFNFSATGGTSANFEIAMYGFGNVIVLQYIALDDLETENQQVQDIIASFTFD